MAARHFLLVVLLAAIPIVAGVDQTQISSYATARDKKAYTLHVDVSPSQSTDIYCGLRFKVDPDKPERRPATWLSLEHAYPAQWMADALGCANRTECRKDPDTTEKTRFNHAEGDLHNLFPAVQSLNSDRGERLYGETPGTETREVTIGTETFACEFQSKANVVEPRRIAKGNLASGILYVCVEYDFLVDPDMLVVLKKWNKSDKPTVF